MRNALFFIFCLLAIFNFTSCSDNDIVEGFTKVELKESLKCITDNEPKEMIDKRLGMVVLYKDKETNTVLSVYLEDKDNCYNACTLPEEYQIDGLIITFSGTVYYTNPAALTYNPLNGLDFEITELWIKK
ncbi:hypothetical protein GGR21_001453 [Dysgonomonas hofstadii]|uniref:Lipoprotein n=1 Tax=Dysgonomonas hofstadii TaxID=637886 RepID=A0A840CHW9_9BACT|nr:hypothetical protein [Dysgonomonas hofstadii]MBB4035560.1 hypothetical protein [Dysgonomonas hofstadii]